MTWWLKAAEELRTLRHLGIAGTGSVVAGFVLEAPTLTIEGEATELPPAGAGQPASSAGASPPPDAPQASPQPRGQGGAPDEAVTSSFLRGERRYKLRHEIGPQQRKAASR
jgi:hypothetical protein